MLQDSHPRSSRGVSGDDPEGGAGSGVLRQAARNRSPREARDPALQALRPGCEELAARIRKATARRCRTAGAQGDGSAAPGAQNRHGGAPRGERPASWGARRLARRLACRVISAFTRVFDARWQAPRVFRRAPERLSALRPPLSPGERSKGANPGRRNAPRERDGLFDIVRRSASPAHFGETSATNPTRVVPARGVPRDRKSAFPRVHSPSKTGVNALNDALCVAGAPLRGPITTVCRLWVPARRFAGVGRNDDGLVRTTHQPVAVGNDRWFVLPVSALLFTGNAATSTCRAVAAYSATHRWSNDA